MAEQQEEVSLRDSITAAWDADQEPSGEPDTDVKEPDVDEPAPQEEPAQPVKEEPKPDGEPPSRQPPKEKPEAKEKQEVAAKPAKAPAQLRPPGTWKASAREKWAAVPPEVQQEILRRERDIHNGFTELGKTRQFAEQFYQTVAPYSQIIAAEGGQPLAVVNNLMQTAAALYSGSASQKVATVGAIIKNFGVDIRMLDAHLAGEAPTPNSQQSGGQQPNIQNMINAAVQQAMAPVMRGQQMQDESMQKEVMSEIEQFAQDAKNEWFDDVKDTMADLLEIAARQGKPMDLSTAYQHATMMHSEIAPIMQERALKAKAAEATAKAAAAKRKAVSITGAPDMRVPGQSDSSSLRDDITNAIDSLNT